MAKDIEKSGPKAGKLLAVRCDVKHEDQVKAAFKKAADEFGVVDVCVNNAGLAHEASLVTGSTSDWKEMLDVGYENAISLYVP